MCHVPNTVILSNISDFSIFSKQSFQSFLLLFGILCKGPEAFILFICSSVFGSLNVCPSRSVFISQPITFTVKSTVLIHTISNSNHEASTSSGGSLDHHISVNNLIHASSLHLSPSIDSQALSNFSSFVSFFSSHSFHSSSLFFSVSFSSLSLFSVK